MRQTINIHNGLNLINIKSDGYSECFTVNEEILAIVWRTHLTYYFVSSNYDYLERLKLELIDYRKADEFESIIKNLTAFLGYFQTGKYIISLDDYNLDFVDIVHDVNLYSSQSIDDETGHFTYCNFTEKDTIMFLKSFSEIDHEIVDGYKHKILTENVRPVIVAFGVDYHYGIIGDDYNPKIELDKFIIDGHHKLIAYKDLGINPPILTITRIDNTSNYKKNFLDEYENHLNQDEMRVYRKYAGL